MNPPIDLSNVILDTERLILRPFKLDDLDDFYNYAKVFGVGEKAGWPYHRNKDESLKILKTFIKNKQTFAIVYKHKVIGSLEIKEYDESFVKELNNKMGRELGFVLAKDYWQKGIMTETLKRVIKYLFKNIKLDFLIACHFLDNKGSKRLLEKMGFKYHSTKTVHTRTNEKKKSNVMILENNFK